MLQRLAVPVSPGKSDWAGREGGWAEDAIPWEGSGHFPSDRTAGKLLADACCCASMQRSVASADIIVMEGWGRKG